MGKRTAQNEFYNACMPLRLTELQFDELQIAAEEEQVTVNTLVRGLLVKKGIITEGPEPKARRGFGKKTLEERG